MQKDEEVGKVAQATPIVICNVTFNILRLIDLVLMIRITHSIRYDALTLNSQGVGTLPRHDRR